MYSQKRASGKLSGAYLPATTNRKSASRSALRVPRCALPRSALRVPRSAFPASAGPPPRGAGIPACHKMSRLLPRPPLLIPAPAAPPSPGIHAGGAAADLHSLPIQPGSTGLAPCAICACPAGRSVTPCLTPIRIARASRTNRPARVRLTYAQARPAPRPFRKSSRVGQTNKSSASRVSQAPQPPRVSAELPRQRAWRGSPRCPSHRTTHPKPNGPSRRAG